MECGIQRELIAGLVDAEKLRAKTNRTPDPVIVERLRKAMEILNAKIGDRLKRLELLTNFVPNAGFVETSATFASAEEVEAVLRKVGPFYAGGGLAIRKRVKISEALLSATEKGISMADLEYINELDPASAHALVICGVKGGGILCVDPNASDKQVEIDFTIFRANVKHAIAVGCDGCPHLRLQERTI